MSQIAIETFIKEKAFTFIIIIYIFFILKEGNHVRNADILSERFLNLSKLFKNLAMRILWVLIIACL